MQVLEVYHENDKNYYYLSRGVIDAINTTLRPPKVTLDLLSGGVVCNWRVTADQLRVVLKMAATVSDATELMGLIINMGNNDVALAGTEWKELTTCCGQWYDLKKTYRAGLEARGINGGTFIFQEVS